MPDEVGELALSLEIEMWVAEQVELAGAIRLFHERPWGAVWRVPVVDGVAWLKICAPVQAFEPRLTAELASRWPRLMPEVLAHDGARGWLLLGDAGERLGFGSGPDTLLSLLPAYADLQRGEVAYATRHLEAGVPDRRLEDFPALYDAMLAHELPLSTTDRAKLQAFAPRLSQFCQELESAGVPATIQHDDLHAHNVYPDGKILDWGDACVSHPFLTLFVPFLHLQEMEGLPRDDPWLDRLRDAYLEQWGRPGELRQAFELADRIGPFANLFKELRVLDAVAEDDRHHLTGLHRVLTRCIALATA